MHFQCLCECVWKCMCVCQYEHYNRSIKWLLNGFAIKISGLVPVTVTFVKIVENPTLTKVTRCTETLPKLNSHARSRCIHLPKNTMWQLVLLGTPRSDDIYLSVNGVLLQQLWGSTSLRVYVCHSMYVCTQGKKAPSWRAWRFLQITPRADAFRRNDFLPSEFLGSSFSERTKGGRKLSSSLGCVQEGVPEENGNPNWSIACGGFPEELFKRM